MSNDFFLILRLIKIDLRFTCASSFFSLLFKFIIKEVTIMNLFDYR